jgi:caa(3)-type oxidase subunit IV
MNTARAIPFPQQTEVIEQVEPKYKVEPGIKLEIKLYLYVFGCLLLLTGLTVGLWALHLPWPLAPILAIAIAAIKVSLVVCFFMHLLSERWIVPLFIGLAVIHMVGLISGTYLTEWENAKTQVDKGGHYIQQTSNAAD